MSFFTTESFGFYNQQFLNYLLILHLVPFIIMTVQEVRLHLWLYKANHVPAVKDLSRSPQITRTHSVLWHTTTTQQLYVQV